MSAFSYWLVSVKTRKSIFSIHIKRFALFCEFCFILCYYKRLYHKRTHTVFSAWQTTTCIYSKHKGPWFRVLSVESLLLFLSGIWFEPKEDFTLMKTHSCTYPCKTSLERELICQLFMVHCQNHLEWKHPQKHFHIKITILHQLLVTINSESHS